mmetsp:Transcript_2378/g.6050  ORF Transcript_2378/g.6050 Transcript_2378/m.6050 type:complete len:88 (+) Transcript_2378:148-411(+)
MRINGAPTRGHEADVGGRTTHRFVNNAYVGWREGDEVLLSKWSGRGAGSRAPLPPFACWRSVVISGLGPRFSSHCQRRPAVYMNGAP